MNDSPGQGHLVTQSNASSQEGLNAHKGDFTPSSAFAVRQDATPAGDSIHRVQVAQTVKSLPLLLLFHASAMISLRNVAHMDGTKAFQSLWLVAAAAVGLGFGSIFVLWRRGYMHAKPGRALHLLELLGLLLGLVWCFPIASAALLQAPDAVFPIAGITLAMLGIGVVSMIRVPVGTTVFAALLATTLARSMFVLLPQDQTMASLVCAIYGLVLIGITLNSHWDFLRRSRAEIEVQRQKQVIRLLLNDFERGTSDWLWETDAEGRLKYFSPRLAEVLQLPNEQVRGKHLAELLQPHATPETWSKLEQAMAHQHSMSGLPLEVALEQKREFWEFVAHPLRDLDGVFMGYRGVGRDVTATRVAQQHMMQAMEASERASAAKSQFLAVISHELRTPINSIVGFSELLAKDRHNELAPATRSEFCETILESSRHLQVLINDLLDATRIERGTLRLNEQDLDACELVEVAIKLCRENAEKNGISIVGRLSEYITLQGDMTRLKQVIINLLTNAIKFSPKGGVVHVDMQRGSDGQFILAVRDAGIGIPAEEIERVFDPFVQVDEGATRRFGGIGLGLAIARRIARLHDGDVRLDSKQGSGTTALLVLPKSRVVWPKTARQASESVA